jgi:hypothetical protein
MKREHLEDPGVDGRIILKWIFAGFLKAVINFRAPENAATSNFLTV